MALLTLTTAIMYSNKAKAGYENVSRYTYDKTLTGSSDSAVELKNCQKAVGAELEKLNQSGRRAIDQAECAIRTMHYGEFQDDVTSVTGGFTF